MPDDTPQLPTIASRWGNLGVTAWRRPADALSGRKDSEPADALIGAPDDAAGRIPAEGSEP
jgi:hypothetical protein